MFSRLDPMLFYGERVSDGALIMVGLNLSALAASLGMTTVGLRSFVGDRRWHYFRCRIGDSSNQVHHEQDNKKEQADIGPFAICIEWRPTSHYCLKES